MAHLQYGTSTPYSPSSDYGTSTTPPTRVPSQPAVERIWHVYERLWHIYERIWHVYDLAHIRQSRPDSGPGFQDMDTTFQKENRVVSSFSSSAYSRCCIRICSAMVEVPHRPLLSSLPTNSLILRVKNVLCSKFPCQKGLIQFSFHIRSNGNPNTSGAGRGARGDRVHRRDQAGPSLP